ncbi:hypothetical protein BH23ACT12_BH23ACT12_02040 [soil metagenome]
MTEKKNFWQTAPGMITGLAAILTATVGLIPILTGGDDNPQPEATQSAGPTPSSPNSGGSSSSSSGNVAPKAVVTPKSLDFGQVGSARTAKQTATVANSGNEYLVIDDVSIEGRNDVFSVEAEECLGEETGIAPGDKCEVTVSFRPTSPGSFAGVLEIEHSGSDSPSRVALNGEGTLLNL